MCGTCGCSITGERQKGHNYYRCTKKRGKCSEPYLREEVLSDQIDAALQRVALPLETKDKILNHWAKERGDARHKMADLQRNAASELAGLRGKLDRLLDAHLSGAVDRSEYLAKKESLLNRKLEIEGKLASFQGSAISWLEPAKEFLESAHQAGQRATRENPETLSTFFRNIGSNPTVMNRKLKFSYGLPWNILARKSQNIVWWS